MANTHTFSVREIQRLDGTSAQDEDVTPINLIASIITAFSPMLFEPFFSEVEDAYVELVVRHPLSETRFEHDGRMIMVNTLFHYRNAARWLHGAELTGKDL